MNVELCINCIFKKIEHDIKWNVNPDDKDEAYWEHYKKFRGMFYHLYAKHKQRIPCFADINKDTPWSEQMSVKYAKLEYCFQPMHKPANHCPYVLEHLVCKGVK